MSERLPGQGTSPTGGPTGAPSPSSSPYRSDRRRRPARWALGLTAAGVAAAALAATVLGADAPAAPPAHAAAPGRIADASAARGDDRPGAAVRTLASEGRERRRPLRIMPLGDSITFGVGSSTRSGYRGALYGGLRAELAVDFVGSRRSGDFADLDNEGHPGALIRRIARDAAASVPVRHPDVILLHAGTNDMNRGNPATAPAHLAALVDQLHADAPGATLVVATLVPARTAELRARIAVYNAEVRRIVQRRAAAGRRILLADMGALTPADLVDKLHPHDAGYAKMATAWHAALGAAAARGWLAGSAPGGPVTEGR
ncbi:SGNH/GDSL hydrolase family protein [Streptomyces lichenis]|uniref:SGNH/GDSL hydrolase family protein n=1 Tax=Streptomyces lichenis TaxID=2306967 RepID=A0ABT0I7G1_9ACTN|nr:SGNH/GDSL hydrolase family protein [Streptomyces lichenis]MCK8677249.1 SGNH/GDSL hydrolase family protein [Streptomyces lichenis]